LAELIETLGLSIAKQLLTSGVLDKRLYAINYLAATIEQVKISEYHRDHHMSMLDRYVAI
jgi:predicted metallo-beta-lactamase superfamily hydrolase